MILTLGFILVCDTFEGRITFKQEHPCPFDPHKGLVIENFDGQDYIVNQVVYNMETEEVTVSVEHYNILLQTSFSYHHCSVETVEEQFTKYGWDKQ